MSLVGLEPTRLAALAPKASIVNHLITNSAFLNIVALTNTTQQDKTRQDKTKQNKTKQNKTKQARQPLDYKLSLFEYYHIL